MESTPVSIDYCFSVAGPWAYLGSARFIDMVERHGVHVNVLPLDYKSDPPASMLLTRL